MIFEHYFDLCILLRSLNNGTMPYLDRISKLFSTPCFWVKSQFKDKENLITNINWRTLSSPVYVFSWAEFEFSTLQLNWLQHCSHSKTSKWIACSSILYIGSISWQEAFKHIAVQCTVLQNRILILLFFRLRVQFCMYKNTLDTLQVLPIV